MSDRVSVMLIRCITTVILAVLLPTSMVAAFVYAIVVLSTALAIAIIRQPEMAPLSVRFLEIPLSAPTEAETD